MEIEIHYLRPPDHEEVFRQRRVHEDASTIVTLATDLAVDPPISIDDEVVLETGSDVVWFTFPDVWHDVGRFHTADGTFRGWYANILTPPTFHDGEIWRTTDLFLDVWLGESAASPVVLDREEFEEAVARGWIDARTRTMALTELSRILAAHRMGAWPPEVARSWTLERAREAAER